MLTIPHLETDVTQACQLSCVACNHSVPLWRKRGPWQANPAQVEQDLGALAKIVHADRWGALGGEPLLHRNLLDILYAARRSRVADKTEVWTNGLLLSRQPEEFWRAFDVLVLSIYPGKHTEDSLAWIRKKCADTGVALEEKDERHFPNFKTMLERTPTDRAATIAKFAGCFFRSFSRVANFGYFFTCCCGPHLPLLVLDRHYGVDGIPIAGLTEHGLHEYLTRTEPLESCYVCAGRDTAQPVVWREERDPDRWLAASAGVV